MDLKKFAVICQTELLAFWDTDEETLVIATNGFVKKTQKTPQKDLDIAIKRYKDLSKR